MIARLRQGWATWRRMGVRRGTVAAARAGAAILRAPLRRWSVRVRPLRATPSEVRAALNGVSAGDALRGPARRALPTVERWRRELEQLDDSQRRALTERAESIVEHRFDLLGSGPTDLGPRIDWQRDFKTGRAWPLEHITRVPIVLGGGSDIKVPWELSRFQHAPLLAAAFLVSGDQRFLDELGAQLRDWLDANPVEVGANWACTMDVAIRAANWVAALALVPDEAEGAPWFGDVVGSLLLHGRFIRAHLEWGEVRGNHYLSDVVGLLPVAALFSAGAEGRAWAQWATGELESEMLHQVRADGCDHEASVSYHRLVTELFVCGTQAADALCPGRLSAAYRERLALMLQFAADHTRADGFAPQVGDADSGRYLPLGDYGTLDFRDHRHLFRQAAIEPPTPRDDAAYAEGGFHVARRGELFLMVRSGDVGLAGIGAHAHNDQLSFEFAAGDQPLVVDPGSYLYTADPAARNRFRSTAYHSTVRVDGAEQNPLRTDYLFALEDRTRAETLAWRPEPDSVTWEGRHHGYAGLPQPLTHTRRVRLDGAAGELEIVDTFESAGPHDLEWTFPLAPGASATREAETVTARWPSGVELTITATGCVATMENGAVSPAYGVREPATFIRLRRRSVPGTDLQAITLRYCRRP